MSEQYIKLGSSLALMATNPTNVCKASDILKDRLNVELYNSIFNQLNKFIADITTRVSKELQISYENVSSKLVETGNDSYKQIMYKRNQAIRELILMLNDIIDRARGLGNDTFYTVKSLIEENMTKSKSVAESLISSGNRYTNNLDITTAKVSKNIASIGLNMSKTVKTTMESALEEYKNKIERKLNELKKISTNKYTFQNSTLIYTIIGVIVVIWLMLLIQYSISKKLKK